MAIDTVGHFCIRILFLLLFLKLLTNSVVFLGFHTSVTSPSIVPDEASNKPDLPSHVSSVLGTELLTTQSIRFLDFGYTQLANATILIIGVVVMISVLILNRVTKTNLATGLGGWKCMK